MEEAFRHGIIPAITLPAHALLDAMLFGVGVVPFERTHYVLFKGEEI